MMVMTMMFRRGFVGMRYIRSVYNYWIAHFLCTICVTRWRDDYFIVIALTVSVVVWGAAGAVLSAAGAAGALLVA